MVKLSSLSLPLTGILQYLIETSGWTQNLQVGCFHFCVLKTSSQELCLALHYLFIFFWLDTHLFHLYFLLKSIMVFCSSIKAQQGLALLGAEPSWLQHWALGVRL